MLVCHDSIWTFSLPRLNSTSQGKTTHTSIFITWARQRSPHRIGFYYTFCVVACIVIHMWRFICIIESKLDDVTNRRMCAVPTNGRFCCKLSFSAELLISFQQIWADIFVPFPSFHSFSVIPIRTQSFQRWSIHGVSNLTIVAFAFAWNVGIQAIVILKH